MAHSRTWSAIGSCAPGNEREVPPKENEAEKREREAVEAEQRRLNEQAHREFLQRQAGTRGEELDARAAARRALKAALEGCRLYVKDSCDSALRSPVLSTGDREEVLGLRRVVEAFDRDQELCKSGMPEACDAAIASPAADTQDRERLGTLKRGHGAPKPRCASRMDDRGRTSSG